MLATYYYPRQEVEGAALCEEEEEKVLSASKASRWAIC
jgi:hypothetical protein